MHVNEEENGEYRDLCRISGEESFTGCVSGDVMPQAMSSPDDPVFTCYVLSKRA